MKNGIKQDMKVRNFLKKVFMGFANGKETRLKKQG